MVVTKANNMTTISSRIFCWNLLLISFLPAFFHSAICFGQGMPTPGIPPQGSTSPQDGTPPRVMPPFKTLRYDEDYHSLSKDTNINWYTKAKYSRLSKRGDTYISFGGDIRYQYFFFNNEDWGESPVDKDGYVLTRYLAHADLHAGKHFRTFVQLQSSLANGMEHLPSPVDENQLDLHQAFFDLSYPLKKEQKLIFRFGRQELAYGSQRLVSVREGPNNRQAFDAARFIFIDKKVKMDLFFSHYVRSKPGIFDDGFNKNIKFWGAYTVLNKVPFVGNLDIYYFGLWKSISLFDDGIGEETRHSIGGRIWNSRGNFRYDIEGLYQTGSLANQKIKAWTFSVNGGYKFNNNMLKPELGLKTELISGNRIYDDKKLQTFNPLFPRGGYFGLASLIGPSNLSDIHPSINLELSEKLNLNFDSDIFWRYSKNDGIYAPNAIMIYSGKQSDQSFIGSQYSTDLAYTPNRFLYFRVEFTWFDAGKYLKDVGPGKDIIFVGTTVQLKF
jgi:hypothetical protein